MEETEVPARSQNDIAGQMQAMFDFQRGKKGVSTINTKHILFIVSGAFDGLEKIIRKRLREATIGFAARNRDVSEDEALNHAQTRDFIDFGFEPEFIGRLPVRVVCQPLGVDDLFTILKNSEGSIIRQYEQTFGAYGIEVLFSDSGLRQIAELAQHEGTGARGLMTVCERVLRDFKYELPSTSVRRFVVTKELVENPSAALESLLVEHKQHEQIVTRGLVFEFADRFKEAHGLKIEFTEAAADALVTMASEQHLPVRDFCAAHFKDFQFGLKLISQNTGQQAFKLDVDAIQAPDKTLSRWVVESYRKNQAQANG
jgi:hypothetical protein